MAHAHIHASHMRHGTRSLPITRATCLAPSPTAGHVVHGRSVPRLPSKLEGCLQCSLPHLNPKSCSRESSSGEEAPPSTLRSNAAAIKSLHRRLRTGGTMAGMRRSGWGQRDRQLQGAQHDNRMGPQHAQHAVGSAPSAPQRGHGGWVPHLGKECAWPQVQHRHYHWGQKQWLVQLSAAHSSSLLHQPQQCHPCKTMLPCRAKQTTGGAHLRQQRL